MWFVPDPVLLAPASRAVLGKKMELYAGMVENLDYHVGRLIDHLKQIGELREHGVRRVRRQRRRGHRPLRHGRRHGWLS
jgi:hypothetical protein